MVLIMSSIASAESIGHQPLLAAEEFQGLSSTYLYTGAQAPALTKVSEAVAHAVDLQSNGPAGREQLQAIEAAGQEEVARAIGCTSGDVAFTGDASTAWNLVAGGLHWAPGDNVVLNVLEHPSVFYPFLRLAARGLELRFVDHDGRWQVTADAVAAAVDSRTRGIALSHVAYLNGVRNDVPAISDFARAHHVPLFVDWSHSLGVLPIDSSLCDIGISASYKWSLGPYGVGIVFWNRERFPGFVPGGAGWRSTPSFDHDQRFSDIRLDGSASRFRLGGPSFSGIAGVTAGLRRLAEFGPTAVAAHSLALTRYAHNSLTEAGFDVITPLPEERRSGNIAFHIGRAVEVGDALSRRGVLVWAGDGRVRASFHAMNDLSHVDALVTAMIEVTRELGLDRSAAAQPSQ